MLSNFIVDCLILFFISILLFGEFIMLKVFSVFDSKVGAYMNPIFLRSKGEAIRVFEATVNTVDHDFYKWSADYTLFELGEFDNLKGTFKLHTAPISIGCALEFFKPRDPNANVCDISGAKLGNAN
jgi:hypothetical protein